jgi:hypothetical protein
MGTVAHGFGLVPLRWLRRRMRRRHTAVPLNSLQIAASAVVSSMCSTMAGKVASVQRSRRGSGVTRVEESGAFTWIGSTT